MPETVGQPGPPVDYMGLHRAYIIFNPGTHPVCQLRKAVFYGAQDVVRAGILHPSHGSDDSRLDPRLVCGGKQGCTGPSVLSNHVLIAWNLEIDL